MEDIEGVEKDGAYCLYVFKDILVLAKVIDDNKRKKVIKLIRLDDNFVAETFENKNSIFCLRLKPSVGESSNWTFQILVDDDDSNGKEETKELKREITHLVVHFDNKRIESKSTFRQYMRLGKNKGWSHAFLKIKSAKNLMGGSVAKKRSESDVVTNKAFV